jgi:hypothetical protein
MKYQKKGSIHCSNSWATSGDPFGSLWVGLITPITWPEIALVWGYSITWAFLTDWAKVRVYHHFEMETTRHQNFLRIVQQSLHHQASHTGLR